MASVPVTELKLGICISSPLSPTLQSPHNAVAEISVARLINLYFMLIWCVMSLSEKKVFIVELRLICFQRPAPPLTRYANCIKKTRTSTHFATTENLPNIPPPWLAVFWRVMSFEELLKEFIWMMSYEERKGFVLRVSGLDVTVVGAGAGASKVQVWAPPAPGPGRPQNSGV